jgi:hypothetical protein
MAHRLKSTVIGDYKEVSNLMILALARFVKGGSFQKAERANPL